MPTEYISNRYMAKLGMPAQQVTWDEALDFDEVAKFFSVPVAEAANILGVCSSTLKRICRANGLPRWPHRKFLGGKSVEEIKQEAVRAKHLAVQEQMYNSQPSNMAQMSATQNMNINMMQAHAGRTNLRISTTASSTTKMPIPSFLDDFRHGFPLKGLEAYSDRWWGKAGSVDSEEAEEADSKREGSVIDATKLVRLRKRKADCLRKALSAPASRGFDSKKVEDRQVEILKFVFGDEMPKQWTYALS